jgi:hypothetical protein
MREQMVGMSGMMQQHRGEMQKACHGAGAAAEVRADSGSRERTAWRSGDPPASREHDHITSAATTSLAANHPNPARRRPMPRVWLCRLVP